MAILGVRYKVPFLETFIHRILAICFCLSLGSPALFACGDQVGDHSREANVRPKPGPFGRHWHNEKNFLSSFAGFDSILMLAAGEDVLEPRKVARAYPHVPIVGSDLYLLQPPAKPYRQEELKAFDRYARDLSDLKNLNVQIIDLTEPIPYPDNSFELVYMNAGLCHCGEDQSNEACCAGIAPTPEARSGFLREIWRVMRKPSPHALGFLHGHLRYHEAMQWRSVCEKLTPELGFICELHHEGNSYSGVKLKVAN